MTIGGLERFGSVDKRSVKEVVGRDGLQKVRVNPGWRQGASVDANSDSVGAGETSGSAPEHGQMASVSGGVIDNKVTDSWFKSAITFASVKTLHISVAVSDMAGPLDRRNATNVKNSIGCRYSLSQSGFWFGLWKADFHEILFN